ncbi:fructose-6-phosphate aldolase [Caldifermentibacillus hisashii]|jgi:transaldolase|uniref:Probable transaldolase n=1 Tax=Caldifermentibacillus hisashii TaxID=996558 RepID=A0ABU9K0Q8_9BACI|nr:MULTISPECIES: fructose-6-phosphate aldolase [Bacillaceae]AWI13558.1 fructose-6-phosphate aldolase [Caldibacillus thermoamylovorans]MCB7070871.1 fructose-6-phosphate aldolase [Caldibacillus sp. 210928-DFI.2.22]MCB7074364.1 fructose-6-phosphate aldolase [Caldibacillus sp. 210928-DFI.2.18]MCM3799484.1 fructose-6-phosphate aldolase [Caldibacillus thermoamylovorans]MDL0420825.1 fructose-6-phosphate aldolase [Caldibacillus thermoamylovorans]
MKFFLDTANVEEIKRVNRLGLVDGVTTNPTLIAREGRDFEEVIKEICSIVDGPVSAEVIGLTTEEMVNEARVLAGWAPNVVVKIPMTEDGLAAVNILTKEGIKTNVTLIFSVAQGLMAAKAGATYVSPFVGRLDDIGVDGLDLIVRLKQTLMNFNFETEIITASVRNLEHVEAAALAGADIATIPGSLFPKLWSHPLTDKGIEQFLEDWKKVPAKK